jgi:putative ABC transport system permease protein
MSAEARHLLITEHGPLVRRVTVLTTAGSTLGIAASGILANKARTTLTLLGMIIGVASVIVAVAIGNGSSAKVINSLNALGTNLVEVQPGATFSGGVRGRAGSASTLTAADAQALADQAYPGGSLPDVQLVAPEDSVNTQAVAGSNNTGTSADGVTPEYLTVRDAQVATGRFITEQDVINETQVAVLGATAVTNLFPDSSDPTGSTITLSGIPFQVVGTMVSKGGSGGVNQDDTIYIPLSTAEFVLSHTAGTPAPVTAIDLEATRSDTTTQASNEVETLLRGLHHLAASASDDFTFLNQTSIQQTAADVSGTLTTLLAGVSACALLVSGIGIMNIMLVTVTERTREIGLRKAVGARKVDILSQFLVESILISGLGGAIGVALSFIVAWVLTNVNAAATGFATSPPLITADSVFLAFGVSLVIGLFFGSYPASRAAALDPIQALRYE